MSSISRLIDPNPPSPIASIQRGTFVVAADAASQTPKRFQGTVIITAINLAKSALTNLGATGFYGGNTFFAYSTGSTTHGYNAGVAIELASATTIRWNRKVPRSSGTVSYEIITYA